ncbi:hypothetical protein CFO_g5128 [Ceratocystis platani]|uniref:Uncharacterized protein n=1 Tax=Ceratocystis fimbriata f. sp. platani TaxID=88771 RepID=A0A0F8CPA0_CERFI|nr:hypothetical protein CFO_g5128 [Ceratocystis platani]
MEHKVVTILDNNLRREIHREERLRLPQILHGLCYKQNIPCNEMKSIVMDIDDSLTHLDVKTYREITGLAFEQDIEITANQPDWDIFSPTIYYRYATETVPGANAEKITIKEERRVSEDPKYTAVIADVMVFSFEQPDLKNEEAT